MAYADKGDVQARIPRYVAFTIGASSDPSETQVAEWITESESEVNAALRQAGYSTVPATNADDMALIKGKVANKVALLTLFQVLGFEGVSESAREELSGWREFLKGLKAGNITLVDQQPSVARIRRARRLGTEDSGEY